MLSIGWLCLGILAGPATGSAEEPSPLFQGQTSDVWLLDQNGATTGTFNVGEGKWTTAATAGLLSAQIDVETLGPVNIPLPATPLGGVLVNQMSESAPPLAGGLEGISLKGLSAAITNPNNPNQPSHEIDPNPGLYSETIAVEISAVGGLNNPNDLVIYWSVNGGQLHKKTSDRAEFFLHAQGSHEVQFHVEQGNGYATTPSTVTYTLDNSDAMRDTDGDGLPDAWEIANGLNPLTPDAHADRDGDGTSDFDEILRGTDPDDPADHPKNLANDPDCDGWSTWDETLRGTLPNELSEFVDTDGDGIDDTCKPKYPWSSTPVARRSSEIEYILSGNVWSDPAQTTLRPLIRRLTVVDPFWQVFFDQLALPDAAAIAAAQLSGEADLPPWLRASTSAAALATGQLPAIRIPGGSGSIVRVQDELTPGGDPGTWVAKAWLPGSLDLTPAAYNLYLATEIDQGNDLSWTNPALWLVGYRNYLAANVLEPINLQIDPTTGLGLALLEAAIGWHSELSSGVEILLGNPEAIAAPAAVSALDETLAASGRNWLDLLADYSPLVAPGGELSSFRTQVLGYFADPGTIPVPVNAPPEAQSTTEKATAALVQGDPGDDDFLGAYFAKLYVVASPEDLAIMTPTERAALLDPAGDSDGDGLWNATELAVHADNSGNPLALDSDGDGFPDSLDPCLSDPQNLCVSLTELEADDDGDGVINSLDNCLNIANSLQADTNEDAIGDDCLRYANIRTPVANARVYPGGAVNFTSIVTEEGSTTVGPLSYNWDFGGGAANSSAQTPGPVTFSLPGTWPVTLTVSNGAMHDLGTDVRTVTVLGDIPLVAIVGSGPVPEGDVLHLSAAASSPYGDITHYGWTFGDGNLASGAATSHQWAQDGSYEVRVEVHDAIGAPATDSFFVTVTDTVPQASFVVNRSRGPLPHTVAFSENVPTPYDGLAGIEWNFGDGSPASTISAPTHVFTTSATPTVAFSAIDGDGSIASVSQRVQVLTDFNLLPDSDLDGISDAFEVLRGSITPTNDTDNDGMSDLAEFNAGTDFEDPADTPPGSGGVSDLLFGDPFVESFEMRWSEGLTSDLAISSVSQANGRLLFDLQQPLPGDLCQTASLVGFTAVDAVDLWMTATLDAGTAGTSCIGIVSDTDYFSRAEACLFERSGGLDLELRITEGDNVTVTPGGSIPVGFDRQIGLKKFGPDFNLTLDGITMASATSMGSIGDNTLRPYLSTENCTEDSGPTELDIDDLEVIYVPEAAIAAQLLAGVLGLRFLYRRRNP